MTNATADSRAGTNRIGGLLTTVAGLTVLGGLLRFVGLGQRDFWFDESCTFLYVRDLFAWPEDSSLLRESTNLPYYILLKAWSQAFGHGEAAYRSMSALAGTMTIPLLAWVAWMLRGGWAAGVGAGLVAFHPLHIHYSREARAYALWALILSAALGLLLRACRTGRWRDWAAFGASAWLALVTHYFTVYWLPTTLAAAIWSADRRVFLRRWSTTIFVVGVLFAPYAWSAVLPAARAGGSHWIADGPASSVFESLWVMLPAADYPAHLRGLSRHSPDTPAFGPAVLNRIAEALPVVVVAWFGWLVLRGGVPFDTRQCPVSVRLPVHAPLLVLGVAPLLLAGLYSSLVRENYLVGRYDLVAWPALILWLAALISDAVGLSIGRQRRAAATVATVVLAACSALPVARMLSSRPAPSFARIRANELASIVRRGDLVIALAYDRDYLQYYLWRAGFPAELVAFPSWLESQVGWVDTRADLRLLEAGKVRQDLDRLLVRIDEATQNGRGVWLLADSLDPNGRGPRGPIHNLLLQSLRAAGYSTMLVDADRMILAVTKPERPVPTAGRE